MPAYQRRPEMSTLHAFEHLHTKTNVPFIPENCPKTCTPTATRVRLSIAGVSQRSLSLRDRVAISALIVSCMSVNSAFAAALFSAVSMPCSLCTTARASSSLFCSRSHRCSPEVSVARIRRRRGKVVVVRTGEYGRNWMPTRSKNAGASYGNATL